MVGWWNVWRLLGWAWSLGFQLGFLARRSVWPVRCSCRRTRTWWPCHSGIPEGRWSSCTTSSMSHCCFEEGSWIWPSTPTQWCFLCGGNHFARDGPDKSHPSFNKGKGKGKYPNVYPASEWEMAVAYYMKGKGKPKGKGKGKMSNMLDMNTMWKGKGSTFCQCIHDRTAVLVWSGGEGTPWSSIYCCHHHAAQFRPSWLRSHRKCWAWNQRAEVNQLCAGPRPWSSRDHCEIHAALFSFWEWLLRGKQI